MYSERLLTLIPEKYHKRIVTHEHFYLKEEFNLMGIHLNARNPKEPHDYSGHISCSCHSVEEVKNKKHFYDYVFMSPVYDSISKEGYNSPYTAEELRLAAKDKIIDNKVMALGGITPDNILEVKDFGFSSFRRFMGQIRRLLRPGLPGSDRTLQEAEKNGGLNETTTDKIK